MGSTNSSIHLFSWAILKDTARKRKFRETHLACPITCHWRSWQSCCCLSTLLAAPQEDVSPLQVELQLSYGRHSCGDISATKHIPRPAHTGKATASLHQLWLLCLPVSLASVLTVFTELWCSLRLPRRGDCSLHSSQSDCFKQKTHTYSQKIHPNKTWPLTLAFKDPVYFCPSLGQLSQAQSLQGVL